MTFLLYYSNVDINIKWQTKTEKNIIEGPFADVSAYVRWRGFNGRGPRTSRAWSIFQTASSTVQIGDVSEMGAPSVPGAEWSASERIRNASPSVHVVTAEIAIGAVRDGWNVAIGNGQIEIASVENFAVRCCVVVDVDFNDFVDS